MMEEDKSERSPDITNLEKDMDKTKEYEKKDKLYESEDRIINEQKKVRDIAEKEIKTLEREKPKYSDIKDDFKFNKESQKIFNFLKQKRTKQILMGILLLSLIIFGSWIRLQNMPLLKDNTSGEYIPLALDPYYFLRVAEAINDNGGELPDKDFKRQPYEPKFTMEILPQTTLLIHKVMNFFGDEVSIAYAHLIYPVIFFALGLLVFFFLTLTLTNSKSIAIISSIILTLIPSYLYRTLAGFSDHEAIGMFSFFLALLIFSFGLRNLEKNKRKNLIKIISFGALLGLATSFTIVSWGGIAKFLFMIIPFTFLLFWIINVKHKKENKKDILNYIYFYGAWIFATLIFAEVLGYNFGQAFNYYMLGSMGILSMFTLAFIIVDYFVILYENKIKNEKIKEYRIILSGVLTLVIGLIGLMLIGKDVFGLFAGVIERLLDPFGTDRLGLTVAENKQPYLNDWISQTGKTIFYLSLAGMMFVGLNISKGIKKIKNKALFVLAWAIFIFGILFSRISPSSLFNGDNFISGFIYFGSLIFYFSSFLYIYFKDNLKIKSELLILSSWLVFMLISGRGAIRLFFVITPFFCFMAGYSVINFFNYAKTSKEETLKYTLYIIGIFAVIFLIWSSFNFYHSSLNQAKYTGPSASLQWQKTMSWVRENTIQEGIFVHWWDYGYWVQYLGERPVLSDGGHFEGTFRDHLIGRYVLTSPNPATLLSFMKSNNASYLLIDPTDIGKYTAYSSIGSSSEWDRIAGLPSMISKPETIQETANTTIRIYQGGYGVEDDIIFKENQSETFLPGAVYDKFGSPNHKSYIAGIILEQETNKNMFKQPIGIFIYNQKQYKIPLRYLYVNGNYTDFKEGLNATAFIMPRLYDSNSGTQIDSLGALIYLSPRTMYSTLAQLYLMNDPLDIYKSLELVHSEQSLLTENLESQKIYLGEFVNYRGIQGPIKIWEFDNQEAEEIILHEEFLRRSGEWAEFDNLKFED